MSKIIVEFVPLDVTVPVLEVELLVGYDVVELWTTTVGDELVEADPLDEVVDVELTADPVPEAV